MGKKLSKPYSLLISKGKVFKGESQTIPDQAMEVRDILSRYTSGQSLSVNANVPIYGEDNLLYDVRRKSNIDLAEDRHANERYLDELNKKGHEYKSESFRLQKMARDKVQNGQGRQNLGQQTQTVHTEPPAQS